MTFFVNNQSKKIKVKERVPSSFVCLFVCCFFFGGGGLGGVRTINPFILVCDLFSYSRKITRKISHICRVFRRTWTDTEELLKEKSFFILSFVFLSEFVIRQVQTNIC